MFNDLSSICEFRILQIYRLEKLKIKLQIRENFTKIQLHFFISFEESTSDIKMNGHL